MRQTPFFILLWLILFFAKPGKGSTIDTVETYSASMRKKIKALVIKPDNYNTAKVLPAIYLLHGLMENYKQLLQNITALADYADKYNLLIICPDGDPAGWYFDSPQEKAYKYETYISTEIVDYIDKYYKAIKNRKGRAIIGASMGGHGAFYIAFKHQDAFGAAGSISGCVDIRPYPNTLAIQERLGSYAKYPERWEQNTVINLTHLLTPNSLALIFDCGSEDMFFGINQSLHKKLLDMNIPHDYISRPGGHTWEYMTTALKYQMLFVSNFFKQNNSN